MKQTFTYELGLATNRPDLEAIHLLQKENLPKNLLKEEILSEGFVTVDHELGLLERMNKPYPHIVAKYQGKVIGYALVMTRELRFEIPILIPMFDQINSIEYKGQNLKQTRYVVMGQVCIAKEFRGRGVFASLYERMNSELSPYFQFIITEISSANKRSLRAHAKIGFETILEYKDELGNEWVLVLLQM